MQMESDWNDAIEFVLAQEGGYGDNPNDPGGETNFGISKKSYPNLDIKNLTVEQAREIYRRDFWEPCKCNDLPRAYAIAVFDSAVNQGVRVAIRLMQIGLGVTVDGIIGPKTIGAAVAASPRKFEVVLGQRLLAYHRLMVEKPKLEDFALNWFHRVVSLAMRVAK
jgi:lysozyme family protein